MAIGGSPAGAPRAKDTSRGAAGRFVFVAEVARGYLGALWLARDGADVTPLGTVHVRHVTPLVAASARAAILEGARWAMAGAESPSVEVLESRNAVDLVTPFVEAEPLRSLMRSAAVKHATIEPEVLLGLSKEWVTSLAAAHERARTTKAAHAFGAVHPDSLLVDLAGHVHVIDVGAGGAASAREPWRSDPQRIGYFAPEQLETRGVVDARTDVFAIGIALWEALANRRLFPGNDAKTARERVLKAPIARLDATRPSAAPGVSTAIADLVARCLERDPASRFQSMDELAQALTEIQTAPASRVGGWASSLADGTIAKRRQALERAGNVVASEQRESVAPPSLRPSRPSSAPILPTRPPMAHAADRPSSVPQPRASVPPRPSSVTPTPASVAPPEARASAPPKPTAVTPPPPSARAAEARLSAPPKPPTAVTPPPPSAVAPPPPSARAAAEARASAAPKPPSAEARLSAPPKPPSAIAPPPPSTPEAPQPTEPMAAPRPPADSAENIESLDEEEPGSEGEAEAEATPPSPGEGAEATPPHDDVIDREASIPPPPSKRPPPLPHDGPVSAAPAPATGEPLASPIHTSPLASLTAPLKSTSGLPIWVAIGLLMVAVGASAWILGRSKAKVTVVVQQPPRVEQPAHVQQPARERTVETPPVHIEEQLSAVPSAGPAPSAAPEQPHAEAPRAPKAPSHAPAEMPKHPAPAQKQNSGFKPGGI